MSTSVITERIAESEVGCVFGIHTDKRYQTAAVPKISGLTHAVASAAPAA